MRELYLRRYLAAESLHQERDDPWVHADASWSRPRPTPLAPAAARADGANRVARQGRLPAHSTVVGHVDVNGISYYLPDGRCLLSDVVFRVGDGAKVALVGANGAGKTTLLQLVAGDLDPHEGAIGRSGGLGRDAPVRRLGPRRLDGARPAGLGRAAGGPRGRDRAGARPSWLMMERDDEPTQLRYAQALADWADAGGYEAEVLWDTCTVAALGMPFEKAQWREVRTLSGGEQKRLVLEALLRGPDEVLLLDEPDNYLDVPGKRGSRSRCASRRRRCCSCPTTASCWPARRRGSSPSSSAPAATPPGPTAAASRRYHEARTERFARLEELRRRWDEEHAKLKALVLMYKQKAAYNDGMASRYQAALTRLRKFEEAGPPEAIPQQQDVTMRLRGARTGKRAVVCEGLELTGLMKPFDLEVWYGDRVAVLGSNGSGKSHFLRLLARRRQRPGRRAPAGRRRASSRRSRTPVVARLGARVRPGWFAQTHEHPELIGRTLLDILWRGDEHRDGHGPRAGVPGAGPLRAGARRRAALRVAVRRPAGPAADPAAGAVRRDPAAARRADRQPRPRLGRGAGGGAARRSTARCSR